MRERSKATHEEILAAFQTEETLKAVSARLRLSPNRLRPIWKAVFGEDAFTERGKRIQAAAAAETCRATARTRVYKTVELTCSKCRTRIPLKTNQIAQMGDPAQFVCGSCRYDTVCPVCGQGVDGARGLAHHFRHRREAGDLAHQEYQEPDTHWVNLTEDEEYVSCRVCGRKAETLARHLKAEHGITAEQYRENFPGALIRSRSLTEKRSAAAKNRRGGFGKGSTKTLSCPYCGALQDVSKFLGWMHNHLCAECQSRAEDAQWAGMSEPQDYVTCLECWYRAESLVSHLQHEHPGYRERHPEAIVVSLGSALREKTAIRGVPRSPEFGERIRQAKLIGFTLEDFKPYLEPDGTVDHRRMLAAVGCAWPTLKGYMDALGLKPTPKYIEQAVARRRVFLTVEDLKPYKLGNGKVSPASAMRGLKLSFPIVKRECLRLGLPSFHRRIRQTLCLDAVQEALGGLVYISEWKSARFVNPNSGHRFRFDGFFEEAYLIVEFQGHQHYLFPNAFLTNESYRSEWDALRERDRIKREMVLSTPGLHYMEVLEDEPFTDVAYLRGRLVDLGVLEVRPGGIWLGKKLVWSTPQNL